uniref:Uncharacterized protein n=1 Tax=Arundo donax TaxID=35708 RepID=A0A0A8Y189_ARUDO
MSRKTTFREWWQNFTLVFTSIWAN